MVDWFQYLKIHEWRLKLPAMVDSWIPTASRNFMLPLLASSCSLSKKTPTWSQGAYAGLAESCFSVEVGITRHLWFISWLPDRNPTTATWDSIIFININISLNHCRTPCEPARIHRKHTLSLQTHHKEPFWKLFIGLDFSSYTPSYTTQMMSKHQENAEEKLRQ